MLFPALVIVPGMIAISLHHSSPEGFLQKRPMVRSITTWQRH